MNFLVAAVLGYLLGAIPFGIIVGRLSKGIDLRTHGSHRTGATNALRTLGTRAAAAVFLLDVAKGVAAVLLVRALFADDQAVEWSAAVSGFAAVVGHNWSVFIGFSGGRGVSTTAGALAAMTIWTFFTLVPIVAFVIWRWRYVSLGSITGAIAAPIITAVLVAIGVSTMAALAYSLASGLLVTVAHIDNIGRLRAGTERKLGQKEMVSPHG